MNIANQDTNAAPTIDHVLLARAAEMPDALAFSIDGESTTYGQFLAQVRDAAIVLSNLGLGEGNICVLALPTGFDALRSLFAAQWIGAVPAVINPDLSADLIVKRAGMIGSSLIVVQKIRPDRFDPVLKGSVDSIRIATPKDLSGKSADSSGSIMTPRPNDIAYLQLTSGTTGEPKAARVSHRSLMAFLKASSDRMAVTADDVFVGWVPLHHDLGLVRFAFNPVFSGCPVYLLEPSIQNFKQWLITASEVRATITASPDFGYRIAGRMTDPDEVDLSALRFATNGGEPIRSSTITFFEQRFGLSGVIRPGYGMAETTLGVTSLAPDEPVRVDEHGTVSCGRPYDDMAVRIADDNGDSLPVGTPGEILVRGTTLFSGYLGRREATEESFIGRWFRTGDIGKVDEAGHLYVLGRKRAMIKRAGALIIPREIEEAADQVKGVRFSAAIGADRKRRGIEDLVVITEIKSEALPEDTDTKTVAKSIAEKIKVSTGFSPGEVVLVRPHTIPRTRNGKIQYAMLKEMYGSGDLERQGKILFGAGR